MAVDVQYDSSELITLATESPSPESTVRLCSALHALVSPLLLSTPDVPRLANFFSLDLFPGLIAVASDTSLVARVADVLLDVVWQLDQQIENSAVQYEGIVEGGDAREKASEGRKAQDAEGRLRLAQFVKLLIVSRSSALDAPRLSADQGFT